MSSEKWLLFLCYLQKQWQLNITEQGQFNFRVFDKQNAQEHSPYLNLQNHELADKELTIYWRRESINTWKKLITKAAFIMHLESHGPVSNSKMFPVDWEHVKCQSYERPKRLGWGGAVAWRDDHCDFLKEKCPAEGELGNRPGVFFKVTIWMNTLITF